MKRYVIAPNLLPAKRHTGGIRLAANSRPHVYPADLLRRSENPSNTTARSRPYL